MIRIFDYYENGKFIKRKTIISPSTENFEVGTLLNGPSFEEVIYEDNVKEAIKLILEKLRTENFNILLYGNAGTGKTTTAKMLACETQRHLIYLTGSMAKKKINNMLLNAKENSIVLIDEIHNLPEKVAEIIYPAIQDNEIDIDGERKKLKDLCFIGTTTEPQSLLKPLRDRFKEIELEELSKDKLEELLKLRGCSEEITQLLLNYTTNTRVLNNILDTINLYGKINLSNLKKVFKLRGINIYSGLSKLQEKYLDILKEIKKASLRTLSLHLGKSSNYIMNEIEPELIKKKYILVTSRGRELNPEFADFSYENLKKESNRHHSKYSQNERELAIEYLNYNTQLKEKFGNRYFELVDFIAEKIAEGISPDLIDFASFGTDKKIKDSYFDNYL